MINERVWLVHKRDNYQNCKDENGYPIRRNFPEIVISEISYDSPVDLALKLNDIRNLKDRLNKDYVYTDYNLALEEVRQLKDSF